MRPRASWFDRVSQELRNLKEPGKPPRIPGLNGFLLELYATLKASPLYELYLQTLRRDLLVLRQHELDFYQEVLRPLEPNAVIFDVGANVGHKAEAFRRLKARVYCLEPDRSNLAWLQRRFRHFKKVTVIGKAVSDTRGTLTFNVFAEGSAFNTLSAKWLATLEDESTSRFGAMKPVTSYEVETVTLDSLLDQYGPAWFIKIDVEGHEVNVLRGLSRCVRLLSFEVNLPEFRREGLECVRRLVEINQAVQFNYVGVAAGAGLTLDEWLGADEFAAWLAHTGERYLEVYARNLPASAREDQTENTQSLPRQRER